MRFRARLAVTMFTVFVATAATAQQFEPPYDQEPGDQAMQAYLAREATRLDTQFIADHASLEAWQQARPRYREEYLYMLGLWPMPERTPLHAEITGRIEGDGFVVEMLHYQSRPKLYVTGNLYRPAKVEEGQRLPAVFYVCGHSGMGRDGNKTAYQSHGMWFARHGYVCLVVDTLQLGEIGAIHHGTYREGRWWWHSRGYTPAGVECWNGIRGIDYLAGRDDVDPERIAVTGISGGGAATFWIAAADERVKAAVPVSGMADLESYVGNRVVNGHCDCMFLYNTFQWPWTRIAALIAPRPMLFVNSDQDRIFPMAANERIINRLERLYSLYGRGDAVDAVVSIGGHAYRQDIRQAAYRFINTHLQGNPAAVGDSEVDLASRNEQRFPIEPRRLRVFPEDSDLPRDELNTTIDEHFVPVAKPEPPAAAKYAEWKESLMDELRRVVFRNQPEEKLTAVDIQSPDVWIESKDGIRVRVQVRSTPKGAAAPTRIVLVVKGEATDEAEPQWLSVESGDRVIECTPRGIGDTRWTRKNPPNYYERSCALLGRTVDSDRVGDVIAAASALRKSHPGVPLYVAGRKGAGVLAAYAALLDDGIAGVIVAEPPASHHDAAAPQLLNVLRVCDIPEAMGMIAPRPLVLGGGDSSLRDRVKAIYSAAGAEDKLVAAE